jgi:hypothetical protein
MKQTAQTTTPVVWALGYVFIIMLISFFHTNRFYIFRHDALLSPPPSRRRRRLRIRWRRNKGFFYSFSHSLSFSFFLTFDTNRRCVQKKKPTKPRDETKGAQTTKPCFVVCALGSRRACDTFEPLVCLFILIILITYRKPRHKAYENKRRPNMFRRLGPR